MNLVEQRGGGYFQVLRSAPYPRLRVPVPLFGSGVCAGYPSPADDHIEEIIDLNELLVRNPPATFYIRAVGVSMIRVADPLAPFIKQLWTFAVPALILAGIVGLALGNLRVVAERWLESFVRRLVHGKQAGKTAGTPGPVAGSVAVVDAPHCPTCNKEMVARTAKRGGATGRIFWGCSEYPRCRGTRPGE